MPLTIRFDRAKPMASVEFMVQDALPAYGLAKVEAKERASVQPTLASQEFRNFVEDVRASFEKEFADSAFEILKVSGIVCHDVSVHRPGVLLILEERGREGTIPEVGRKRVTEIAEAIRERAGLR